MKAASPQSLNAVEALVGHIFTDRTLLVQALTHISALQNEKARTRSYQRLEFLGDRVLGLAVSAMLVAAYPDAEEGELSRRLAALVRRETCAEVAAEWQLGPAVLLGDSEAAAGGRDKPAILSDVCEAVIGAIFLDGGHQAAADAIRRTWTARLHQPTRPLRDPKTALQEWAQSLGRPAPVYTQIERTGPDHAPRFTLTVSVDGYPVAVGNGSSKRTAEQVAAETFLDREGLALPLATGVA